MKKSIIVTLICLLLPRPALADITCQGVVAFTMLGPDGTFYVNFGYNRLQLCNVDASVTVNRGAVYGTTTVTPARCQALMSAFMTAKASGKPVMAASARSDCNFVDGDLPNPYPYHFYFY